MKTCSTCKTPKDESLFHYKKSNIDGLDYDCKDCANKKIRDRRSKNNDLNTKIYERTKKGKLVRTYRNMLSRVKGILKKKAHLYEGLEILNKGSFYEWSLNDDAFNRLFDDWVKSDYDLKLSPSIDRKDHLIGYTLNNMRWVTFSFNSLNTSCRKNQYS